MSLPTPLVSIIVPAFNASTHIERTLRSVLAQTLKSLEVVVVDDGSTDDTKSRVERLATADSRIRLLANDRNRGPSYTRNAALEAAGGEWLSILDADDCMQPERLATLVQEAESRNLDMLADNILFVSEHGNPPFDRLLPTRLFTEGPVRTLDAAGFLRLNPPGGNRGIGLIKPIIRTRCVRTSGVRYREELRLAEDLFFYLELVMSGARMALFERGLYEYLVRPDSLSRSKGVADLARMVSSFEAMLDDPGTARAPDVSTVLREHVDEMQSYTLPRYRLTQAVRKGELTSGLKVLLTHPRLPLLILRRWFVA